MWLTFDGQEYKFGGGGWGGSHIWYLNKNTGPLFHAGLISGRESHHKIFHMSIYEKQ